MWPRASMKTPRASAPMRSASAFELPTAIGAYYNSLPMVDTTPMMAQYRQIKERFADCVLFFRLGDFYEMFDTDAREVSSLLDLTLTQRAGVPMCGIPYHAAASYVSRLLASGRKIAVCEQV